MQSNVNPEIKQELSDKDSIPDNFNVFHKRGLANTLLENYEAALEDYNSVISIKSHPHAFANRGWIKHLLGNNKEALLDLEKAHQLDPKNALILNNKAIIYRIIGKADKA